MKEAAYNDRDKVINILAKSFKDDPHVKWLLDKSKHKDKFEITMNYVFEETMAKGAVYLNDQDNATALWLFKKNEKITFRFIRRNLNFFLKIGLITTLRVLRSGIVTHREYSKIGNYCYLYLLGVLPEAQGKGEAKILMNYMIEKMDRAHKPMVLETANEVNVKIYNKKGFVTFKELTLGENTLYLMKRQN